MSRRMNPITEAFGFDGGWGFERRVETKKEEAEFKKLIRRLQWRNISPERRGVRRQQWRAYAKKWWRTATPEQKARVIAYRKKWAAENKKKVLESSRRSHKNLRSKKSYREAENAQKKAKRAEESLRRRLAAVYTCVVCEKRWSPDPKRKLAMGHKPKYCSQPCRSKANYERGKKAGKAWAMRTKEFRKDR